MTPTHTGTGAVRPVRAGRDRPIILPGPSVLAVQQGRKTQHRIVLPNVPASPGMSVLRPEETPRHAAPYLDAYCSQPRTPANPRGMSDLWCWWTRDDRMGREFRVGFQPGDMLWVAEDWQVVRETLDYETGGEYDVFPWEEEYYGDPREHLRGCARHGLSAGLFYAADGQDVNPCNFYPVIGIRGDVLREAEIDWCSADEMPAWASRLTLIVEAVKVERLQDISEEDAVAEGISSDTPAGLGVRIWGVPGLPVQGFEGPVPAYRDLWNDIHGPDAWDANPWVAAITFRVIPQNIDSLGDAP